MIDMLFHMTLVDLNRLREVLSNTQNFAEAIIIINTIVEVNKFYALDWLLMTAD